MPIQNKTMLITYSDSLGNNLKDLYDNLEEHFGDAIGEFTFYHFSHQQVIVDLRQLTTTKWTQLLVIGRMLSV